VRSITGVGADGRSAYTLALTGLAGLSAGALSTASGEYVSVAIQNELVHAEGSANRAGTGCGHSAVGVRAAPRTGSRRSGSGCGRLRDAAFRSPRRAGWRFPGGQPDGLAPTAPVPAPPPVALVEGGADELGLVETGGAEPVGEVGGTVLVSGLALVVGAGLCVAVVGRGYAFGL